MGNMEDKNIDEVLNDLTSNDKEINTKLLKTFLEKFTKNLSNLDNKKKREDKDLVEAIRNFSDREKIVEVIFYIAKYEEKEKIGNILHAFFENLANKYLFNGEYEYGKEAIYFIIYELFLYVITIFIKEKQFNYVDTLLNDGYWIEDLKKIQRTYIFNWRVESLNSNTRIIVGSMQDIRKNKEERFRQAICIKENLEQVDKLTLEDIQQTELILAINTTMYRINGKGERVWYPYTFIFNNLRGKETSFELFARAESGRYFTYLKRILHIEEKEDLKYFIDLWNEGKIFEHSWTMVINMNKVLNYENLNTI